MRWHYEANRDEYTYPRCGKGPINAKTVSTDRPYCVMHMHHNIEIIYIIEGQMEVILYNSESDFLSLTLEPHQAIIINCNIIHQTIPRADGEYFLTFIQPNMLMPSVRLEVGKTFTSPFQDDEINTVMGLMSILHRFSVLREKQSVENVLRPSIANSIMALMLPKMQDNLVEMRGSNLESALINYVYTNYRNSEINTGILSKLFGFSPRKIGEIFKKAVGVGLSRHLNILRINDAKSLLQNTDQSIVYMVK